MNTPRTKAPKRHQFASPPERPGGAYRIGLVSEHHLVLLGQIVSFWVLVEEEMIEILRDLLGGGETLPVRQIFRSIASNEARKKVLLALLERAPINRTKDRFYDDLIAEFYSLNGRRNDYVHGLWQTYEDNATAYLSTESLDDFRFMEGRKITTTELQATLQEMADLYQKLIEHRLPQIAEMRQKMQQPPASPDMPPLPPDEEKT
jgi:hypothetical protein